MTWDIILQAYQWLFWSVMITVVGIGPAVKIAILIHFLIGLTTNEISTLQKPTNPLIKEPWMSCIYFLLLQWIFQWIFVRRRPSLALTSHSRACSTAGGPGSNRSRWGCSDTRRTWRRSRARSARSPAAGSGRRWATRSPRTPLPLSRTLDLHGAQRQPHGPVTVWPQIKNNTRNADYENWKITANFVWPRMSLKRPTVARSTHSIRLYNSTHIRIIRRNWLI